MAKLSVLYKHCYKMTTDFLRTQIEIILLFVRVSIQNYNILGKGNIKRLKSI